MERQGFFTQQWLGMAARISPILNGGDRPASNFPSSPFTTSPSSLFVMATILLRAAQDQGQIQRRETQGRGKEHKSLVGRLVLGQGCWGMKGGVPAGAFMGQSPPPRPPLRSEARALTLHPCLAPPSTRFTWRLRDQ